MALDWYFLRVQVGREDRIRESMVRRLKQAGIENLVPQIVEPCLEIAVCRGGSLHADPHSEDRFRRS